MSVQSRGDHVGLVEVTALELARSHHISAGRPEPLASLVRIPEMSDWLEQAQMRLSKPDTSVAKAAEWFLDNSYLVQRAIRQIEEDLPGLVLRPVAGPGGAKRAWGPPRIYAVACGMLDVANLQLTPELIARFLNAYQEATPLDISELWALPVMLRLCSLEELTSALARLDPHLEAPLVRCPLAPPSIGRLAA